MWVWCCWCWPVIRTQFAVSSLQAREHGKIVWSVSSLPTKVFSSLKCRRSGGGGQHCLCSSFLLHASTLWVWRQVYGDAIWSVGMRLECNILECLHLYENVEVHFMRLANPQHSEQPVGGIKKEKKRMKPQPHSDVSVPNSALEVFSVQVQLRLLTRW